MMEIQFFEMNRRPVILRSYTSELLHSSAMVMALVLVCSASLGAQRWEPRWSSLEERPVPAWYTEARFGIFIHWGPYSVPAWAPDSDADGFGSRYAEWYWQRLNAPQLKIHRDFSDFHRRVYGEDFRYKDFAPMFRAELFDPVVWEAVLRSSGARYAVLTSRHHDGFCLWPSAQAPGWNAVDTGPRRDLAADFMEASRRAGLRAGFYYSLYEWFDEGYRADPATYAQRVVHPQLRDLVQRYRPEILWADGDWEQPDTVWRSEEFLSWLYNDSPVAAEVVVNDRWGTNPSGRHGGFLTSEYGKGESGSVRPWEETRGMAGSFGYNRRENLSEYADSRSLIHQLIQVVSRGGNFLLNIGPAADGTIPVIMQQRLKDIGDWLRVNGEAIYGSSPRSLPEGTTLPEGVFLTAKGDATYAILTQWKPELRLTGIPRPASVTLLGYDEPLRFSYRRGVLTVQLPALTPDRIPCSHAWTLKMRSLGA